MNRKIRYHLSQIIFPLGVLLLLGYFSYHLFTGNRGLLSWKKVKAELQAEKEVYERLLPEKENLENKVRHLRSNHVERDLLDERVRAMLNFGTEKETVIIRDEEE